MPVVHRDEDKGWRRRGVIKLQFLLVSHALSKESNHHLFLLDDGDKKSDPQAP